MRLKVFVSLLVFSVVAVFYTVFTIHYNQEQNNITMVVIRSIETSIVDLSHVLSQNNAEGIKLRSELIDRKLITNKFIKAISIYDGTEPVLYTDSQYLNFPINNIDILDFKGYEMLESSNSVESAILYYDGWKEKEYKIIYYLDKDYIGSYFNSSRVNFMVIFVLFPMILFIVTAGIFIRFIFNPLHALEEYTTTDGVTLPKPFHIFELESLRESTVNAFELLKQEKKELIKISNTDFLTGLNNRYSMERIINEYIKVCDIKKDKFALLFMDIDHFKTINDTLGHSSGDEMLKQVSVILTQALKEEEETVSRIGGDEFIITINYNTDEKLERIILGLTNSIKTQVSIDGLETTPNVSIGIAKYPNDDITLDGLMQKADIALFKAKDRGRNQHVYFTEGMYEDAQRLIELNKNMLTALLNKEFEMYYQPQVDINSNKIVGAEGLIRWNHNGTFISPVEFIPLAEQSGFIVDLGWWILFATLKEKLLWESKGLELTMSINIAAKQFSNENFFDNFKFYLDRFKVDRSQIVLELTEYVFLYNDNALLETFNKIKELGISIALDDFGTGYSSLSYLKKFPIDILKIDKTFIDDYKSVDGKIFLDTIIAMAHGLDLDLVAEGVEEQEQLDFLYNKKCDKYQGYLSAKPMPSSEFSEFIKGKV